VYFTSKSSTGFVRVIAPTGATKLTISVANASNLAFGGPDRKTLYITAGRTIYALPMNIQGMPD
jgi:gluconolactonase